MSDENTKSTNDTKNQILENLQVLTTPEGVQKYILGTKKNGQPRAVYDVVKDYTKPKKHKKHKNKDKHEDKKDNAYTFYLNAKKSKKKKKHKKHKDDHWHI